uniref:Uncharacterized protein n=1 Tax=Bracoviriform glomeratae TaxID=257816 RepID=Q6RY03_9VIRU|nr:hypothetical protein 7 [Bracoviriform glomeratae]
MASTVIPQSFPAASCKAVRMSSLVVVFINIANFQVFFRSCTNDICVLLKYSRDSLLQVFTSITTAFRQRDENVPCRGPAYLLDCVADLIWANVRLDPCKYFRILIFVRWTDNKCLRSRCCSSWLLVRLRWRHQRFFWEQFLALLLLVLSGLHLFPAWLLVLFTRVLWKILNHFLLLDGMTRSNVFQLLGSMKSSAFGRTNFSFQLPQDAAVLVKGFSLCRCDSFTFFFSD